jgi:uncharacterized NAD(P)/FAD-binding protein YdhS
MTLSEIVREATEPLSIVIIGRTSKEKFGFGAISDTELKGAFLNVLAKKMSIDPRATGADLFFNHLCNLGLDKATWEDAQASADPRKLVEAGLDTQGSWQETKNWITRYNAPGSSIGEQYVPRVLLHGMIREFSENIERQAREKDIRIEHIKSEVKNVLVGRNGKPLIDIEQPDGSTKISVDVAAVTIGLSPREIPGGDKIENASLYCSDVHHPDRESILHPEFSGEKEHIIDVGSGLTTVDTLMALIKRNFFAEAHDKRVTVIAPNGKFPHPHESSPSPKYDGSFLKDETVPKRLREQVTAKDFFESIMLSSLHAIGAEYYIKNDNMKFIFPIYKNEFPLYDSGVAELVQEGNNILKAIDAAERAQLASIFPREGEKADDRTKYSWQSVIDHFRSQISDKWESFPKIEKHNWIYHYSRIWGTFRNRVPEKVYEEIDSLIAQRKIIMHKGRVKNIVQEGDVINVEMVDGKIISGNEVLNTIGWSGPKDIPLLSTMCHHQTAIIHDIDGVKGIKGRPFSKIVIGGQIDGNRVPLSTTGFTELRAAALETAWTVLSELGMGKSSPEGGGEASSDGKEKQRTSRLDKA